MNTWPTDKKSGNYYFYIFEPENELSITPQNSFEIKCNHNSNYLRLFLNWLFALE